MGETLFRPARRLETGEIFVGAMTDEGFVGSLGPGSVEIPPHLAAFAEGTPADAKRLGLDGWGVFEDGDSEHHAFDRLKTATSGIRTLGVLKSTTAARLAKALSKLPDVVAVVADPNSLHPSEEMMKPLAERPMEMLALSTPGYDFDFGKPAYAKALRSFRSLKVLSLLGTAHLTDELVDAIAAMGSLEALYLGNAFSDRHDALALQRISALTDRALEKLVKGCPSLRVLCLRGADGVTGAGLKPLSKLRALEILEIEGAQIDGKGLAALGGLGSLRSLRLANNPRIDDLSGLAPLTSLERLWLDAAPKIADLSPLSKMTRMRSLSLAGCSAIGDGALSALSAMTELEELDLGVRDVWVPTADSAKRMPSAAPKLKGAGLAHLAGLKKLRDLRVYQSKSLTDGGLAAMAEKPALAKVDVFHVKGVGKKDAEWLLGLPALRELVCWQTAIPKPAVKKLEKKGVTVYGP